MNTNIKTVMLIDDNKIDNFFHERAIKKHNDAIKVIVYLSAEEALTAIKENQSDEVPEVIFLDINMPGMNGWEFLDEYFKLDEKQRKSIVITMLSTSENPDDMKSAQELGVSFSSKPLTTEILNDLESKLKL